MSDAVHDKPDVTKKVKFDRSEAEERIVDIYVSADTERPWDQHQDKEVEDTSPKNGPGGQPNTHTIFLSLTHTMQRKTINTFYNTGKRPFIILDVLSDRLGS